MNKIEPRFLVCDDEGEPVRKFYTKREALNFLLDGWKLIVLPKKSVIDWQSIELAPF